MPEEIERDIELFRECSITGKGCGECANCSEYDNSDSQEYIDQGDFAEIWERTKKHSNFEIYKVSEEEHFEINGNEKKVTDVIKGQEYFNTDCATFSIDYEKGEVYGYVIYCQTCEGELGGDATAYRTQIKPKVVENGHGIVFDFSASNLMSKNWVPGNRKMLDSVFTARTHSLI